MLAGELTTELRRNTQLPDVTCAMYGFPQGTRSQIVAYYEDGVKIAIAHQFMTQIAATGRPDPKEMLCCGVLMYLPPTAST